MNKPSSMSPAELSAYMRSGQPESWGTYANAATHIRYAGPINPKSRRRCFCCNKRATHVGRCNGIVMIDGCELTVMRWVRTGR
jgi:hypothetical protein